MPQVLLAGKDYFLGQRLLSSCINNSSRHTAVKGGGKCSNMEPAGNVIVAASSGSEDEIRVLKVQAFMADGGCKQCNHLSLRV